MVSFDITGAHLWQVKLIGHDFEKHTPVALSGGRRVSEHKPGFNSTLFYMYSAKSHPETSRRLACSQSQFRGANVGVRDGVT